MLTPHRGAKDKAIIENRGKLNKIDTANGSKVSHESNKDGGAGVQRPNPELSQRIV